MNVLEHMERYGFEQLSVYTDPGAGLRAFIAIHDTTLGPALGGCRVWAHRTEDEALMDVLRLGRAMTYKSAAAGLPLGGGKALIMADPNTQKTEALFRSFGRFVDSLGGRYITTEDVGTTTPDLVWISYETRHVTGLPEAMGGSGDSSQITGFGVFQGMRACAQEVWNTDSLEGRTVAIQGFGKVATFLSQHLLEAGAKLVVTDIYPEKLMAARQLDGVKVVSPEEIYDVPCDIFSPCALGGVLHKDTIPRLRGQIVCGGANNQLLTEEDGERLQRRSILYAPDFIVNAGGVISISCEIGAKYSEAAAKQKTAAIFDTMQRVIATAKRQEITTAKAADRLAEERIASVRKAKRVFLGHHS
ncbi:MAG: Glu/Leu/Phe/Val dehydrogenase [Chloroflexi bacterium]|nr:Glu/Leu/Phe/Val dehydrogenase [Chloroflexota bacterium]